MKNTSLTDSKVLIRQDRGCEPGRIWCRRATGGGRRKRRVEVLKGWEVGEIGGKLRNDAQYFAIVKVLKGGRKGKRGGSQEDPTYLAPFVLTLNPTERS